jgi:hypothetical protein
MALPFGKSPPMLVFADSAANGQIESRFDSANSLFATTPPALASGKGRPTTGRCRTAATPSTCRHLVTTDRRILMNQPLRNSASPLAAGPLAATSLLGSMPSLMLGALLFSSQAYSAPVVTSASGTFTNNGSVTLTGSGFGTKSTAAPLVWDNFEAGATGTKILTANATIGKWDTGSGYDVGVYSTEQAHAGSKSAKLSTAGGAYNLSLAKNGSFPTLYMDWRVRVHYNSIPTRNWKPWRLYGAGDTMQANAVIMCNSSGLSVEPPTPTSFWWDSMPFGQDTWQHYQVVLRESSGAGKADGVVKQYIDGVLKSDHTGVVTRSTSGHWEQIRIGHYWASDGVTECPANAGANIFVDSVYIDTSWNRVELGNSSTYAASTHREIQVPQTWADGSVKVTLNTGNFQSGSTVYIFVLDSNGNVNASGYPIVLGNSTPTSLPSPTNLIIR